MQINSINFNNGNYKKNQNPPQGTNSYFSFNSTNFINQHNQIVLSFKGVSDFTSDTYDKVKDGLHEGWDKSANAIKSLFSRKDYKNLTSDEVKFLESYVNKESEIKQKYIRKIENVKDTFLDRWFDISEKKRNALRNDLNKELEGARAMQDLFEERERENIAFRAEFVELAKHMNYSQEVINALNDDYEASLRREKINQRRGSFDNDFGLKKIAGYADEQIVLQSNFIDKVDEEKSGKVLDRPITNAILFYGPTGCGKTTFAKALAEDADCRFEEVKIRGRKQKDKEDAFFELLEGPNGDDGILAKAQESFLKDNKRTIILVDEVDRFFGQGYSDSFLSDVKNLMNNCSMQNHVTFFLTTNDPKKIPYELLGPHRTGIIVSLDPPNKKNTISVLQHYFRGANQNKIDYNIIYEKLSEFAPEQVYSNSHLEKIADMASTAADEFDEEITTESVLKAINEYNSKNDNEDLLRITKKYLEKYENEKKDIGEQYG